MMTFDLALPELIRVCVEYETAQESIRRYAVVRDVRGRLRLVIEQVVPDQSIDPLERALVVALGNYFAPPILSSQGREDLRGLAKKILEMTANKWPDCWPRSVRNLLGGADKPIEAGNRWTGIERTIGKDAWLSMAPPNPPWPLVKGQTPPIVTFHSFKGGVGRTTLVAAYAIRLASRTKPARVAIVDLDVEAPGIGELFGVRTERGTLDIMVDHIATGEASLDHASASAQIDSSVDPHITIFPAGRIDEIYLQKLARLDFSSAEPGADNPVGMALAAMLKQMKASYDIILVDSRAGLHDLAGMSLHGLAHVDVLVFRGTSQNMTGLGQTLRTLGKRSDTHLVLVETLLPANDDELFQVRRKRTRDSVYDLMCEHIYNENEPPQLIDNDVPHDVVPVRRREWLDGIDSLHGRVAEVLREPEFATLADRISEECSLDPEAAGAEEDSE
jgi:MinD-like ATPase involved in chromosome partitioning or flagellar assembly